MLLGVIYERFQLHIKDLLSIDLFYTRNSML